MKEDEKKKVLDTYSLHFNQVNYWQKQEDAGITLRPGEKEVFDSHYYAAEAVGGLALELGIDLDDWFAKQNLK